MATYAAHLRGVVARGHHYQVRSGGGNVDVFLAAEATKAAAIRPAVRAAAERKGLWSFADDEDVLVPLWWYERTRPANKSTPWGHQSSHPSAAVEASLVGEFGRVAGCVHLIALHPAVAPCFPVAVSSVLPFVVVSAQEQHQCKPGVDVYCNSAV